MKQRTQEATPKIAQIESAQRHGNDVKALREVVQQQAKRIMSLRLMLRMAELAKPLLPSAQMRADIRRYRRAIKVDPDDHHARDWLAFSYMGLGKYNKATRHFSRLIKHLPNEHRHHRNLGYCYEMWERYDRAKAAYKAALVLNKGDAQNQLRLAYWYFERRQYKRAQELFHGLVERGQLLDVAHCYLGHIFRKRRQFSEACDAFGLALEANANCEMAAHYLLVLNHRHRLGRDLAATLPDLAGPVTGPPLALGLASFYEKCLDAAGILVLSSRRVDDVALIQAARLVNLLLRQRPDIRAELIKHRVRVTVIARKEKLTDIPEFTEHDEVLRGVGPTFERPVMAVAEENLLAMKGDLGPGESILIHEVAHAIHRVGLPGIDPEYSRLVDATYDHAMRRGMWQGVRATKSAAEYWAMGAQAWFNALNETTGTADEINTRERLKSYDPLLADLLEEVFGDDEWRFEYPWSR